MDYPSILHLHTMVGVLTLIMFWTAAFSRKGGKTHRFAGKVYLLCILLILASVIPITIFTFQHKGYAAAFGLVFLFVMTFTAAWVARRSIACKNNLRRLQKLYAERTCFASNSSWCFSFVP